MDETWTSSDSLSEAFGGWNTAHWITGIAILCLVVAGTYTAYRWYSTPRVDGDDEMGEN